MISTDALLDVLSRAVDGCAARHSVHVANIANADVPGYQRMNTDFDALLKPDAMSRTIVRTDLAASNQVVRLDQEMALMAQNSLRYQLLIGAFDRTVGLLRSAAREGRGA